MFSSRRGAAAVIMIFVLIMVDLIVVGVVLSGGRDHDVTAQLLENTRALYAAEAGVNMALRELQVEADEDGDCQIGSISHDGDSGNDPGFALSRFLAVAETTASETRIDSYGYAGGARTQLATVVSSASGVTLQETVTAVQAGCCSPLVTPSVQGGTDQTYVLFVATRRNNDVVGVTGGSLTWTERVEQCAGRDQQAVRLWTAEGSPGSAFQVTIDWDDADPRPIVAILHRYSGVGSLEDPTGHNTNGENGGCAGGVDDDAPQLTLTSTVDGSVHVIGLNHRNETVDSYSAGYAQTATDLAGSDGDETQMTSYEQSFDPQATDTFQATIGGDDDWCVAGIVLNP